jgi:hypothetical protein
VDVPALQGSATSSKDARGILSDIPERSILGDTKSDIFGSRSWQPPPPKVVAVPQAPPPPPPPPPMTYRFAGRFVQEGRVQLFVSKGDVPVAVKLGDILDGYVVESLSPSAIELVYPPLGHKTSIALPPVIPGEVPVPVSRAPVPVAEPPVLKPGIVAPTPAAPLQPKPPVPLKPKP